MLLLVALIAWMAPATQRASTLLDRRIAIQATGVTFCRLIETLSKQTGLSFVATDMPDRGLVLSLLHLFPAEAAPLFTGDLEPYEADPTGSTLFLMNGGLMIGNVRVTGNKRIQTFFGAAIPER